uniref:Transmembrane protein n=1 Tax=Medicago truncatula TaxID=3880 RepID=Q2HW85_MEDTR|nr:hypothetical protein MtrDRAFT_AC147774g9v1 [Medicago truncatula]
MSLTFLLPAKTFIIIIIYGEGVPARRYGIRGPIISNERPKQTPMRVLHQHPTAPGVIRVPYPNYGPSSSTQPKFMEFIPTLGFPKK